MKKNLGIDPIQSMIQVYWDGRYDREDGDFITSMDVTRMTNKEHHHVMRDIKKLLEDLGYHSIQKWIESDVPIYNIGPRGLSENIVAKSKKSRRGWVSYYSMNKKGFQLLISGYDPVWRELLIDFYEEVTSLIPDIWKLLDIQYNEEDIKKLQGRKEEFKLFTDMLIKDKEYEDEQEVLYEKAINLQDPDMKEFDSHNNRQINVWETLQKLENHFEELLKNQPYGTNSYQPYRNAPIDKLYIKNKGGK